MKLDPNQRISRLSLQKRALLEAHLLRLQERKSGAGGIPRRGEGSSWPLSFGQQRLWFLDNLEPQRGWYNAPHAFRLEGNLDVATLERALEEVVRRQEVLRTRYESVDGRPVQILGEPGRVELRQVDLRDCPEADKAVEVNRLITDEASREFDLSRDLMVRGALVREQDTRWMLLLVVHHIATDGWSQGILFRELGQFYEAFRRGRAPTMEELPIQYADYAVWQRQRLSGEILEQQLGYWKQQLGTEPPLLELPADRPRPVVLSHRGERVGLELPADLSLQIRDLGRREGATLFMTLLAAFSVLLHRYTSHTDLAVGTPVAGRPRRELEGLIGFFVNTLVLRTNLSGDPSFRELLGRVQQVVLGAYAHQELPFEKLVEELQPERSLSRNPLFQVMFVLANAAGFGLELDGTNVSTVQVDTGTAKFDLTLSMLDQGQGLAAWIEYSVDLFDRTTIERMLGHLRTLLAGIVTDPEQPISKLPLLTEAERHQLLVDWNATHRDCSKDRCIHELFEEQVTRTPEAMAVVYGDQHLTYHHLNARANRLAHYLRKCGVGPEVMVGICLESSVEMVLGLLGVLKAGGAYVPLDPSYPMERLAYLLKDSRASVVLTSKKWSRELASVPLLLEESEELSKFDTRQLVSSGPLTICLDGDWEFTAKESKENPVKNVTAENLAYVIYTSGSTGQPKGVAIEHKSLANYLHWVNESLLGGIVRVIPMVSRLSFDASLKQVFAPLLRGDEVWILENNVVAQPAVLLRLLAQRPRVGLNCVPSLWKSILDASEFSQIALPSKSLASLFVGGEELNKELVDRTFAALPDVQIWNLYGPTETTANATAATIVPDQQVSIGRPLTNTQTYLLDQHLSPVPIGIPGELHCGGACVARGYHNRPDLTAERFLPNPFGEVPGERLYRTGDLTRYRDNGNIEFVGRIDRQVKIRGFRIELGEIEAALRKNAAVEQAVLLAREDAPGDQQLVAYIVPQRGQSLQVSELRGHLKQQLPDYMVPSAFVVLDKVPLTPNGKVDHRALPVPDWSRRESESSYVAPRTLVEESLVGIWAEVLKKEPVGIQDNFFELGGHSLLATQVMSRVRRTFQLDIPLRVLFETPSIEGLAIAIASASAEKRSPSTPQEPYS